MSNSILDHISNLVFYGFWVANPYILDRKCKDKGKGKGRNCVSSIKLFFNLILT